MIWGIIISLPTIALLLIALKSVKSNFEMSPVGWIVVAVMLILLSFENKRLVSVIDAKLNTHDYIESVKETAETCLSALGYHHILSQEEAQIVSIALKTAVPSMSRHIHTSDLMGKDGNAIVDTIGVVAKKSLNQRLWNTLGWVLITLIIGSMVIIIFSNSKPSYKRTRRPSTESYRNERYHHRRSR